MLELLLLALAVNAIYCSCRIAEDWRAGRRDWVAAGLLSLLLLYGVIGWTSYDTARRVSNAVAGHYAR